MRTRGFVFVDRFVLLLLLWKCKLTNHLLMRRGKELSQDLHNEMTEQHSNGTGSQQISQLRNVPRSSIMTMICKWKEHHLTISQSVDQKSHSRTKEHSEFEKDLQAVGLSGSAVYSHGLCSLSITREDFVTEEKACWSLSDVCSRTFWDVCKITGECSVLRWDFLKHHVWFRRDQSGIAFWETMAKWLER